MYKRTLFVVVLVVTLWMFPSSVFAVGNPTSVPNNKFGIHILFPAELQDAARLINSTGGDWGYVTIPIQSGDKDLDKWQKFMDGCKKSHVTPLIRLATEGDYFNTKVWRKPEESDVLDFANFLNSLTWPTQNRYIVVFNEVNRGDEWGGSANPSEYANLLSYTFTVFKSKNQDFFIISSGLDNASINNGSVSINSYTFLRLMNQAVPGIFNQIDGIASHSYPNPAFAKPPNVQDSMSIASYRFEKQLISSLSTKDLPVFITETGWSLEKTSDEKIATYYVVAFSSVWNDNNVVAVTPFLLRAGSVFAQFSFLKSDGSTTAQYRALEAIKKEKGTPERAAVVLGQQTKKQPNLPIKSFGKTSPSFATISLSPPIKILVKWLLKL